MKVFHFVKMSGIGGVQNQFETFLRNVLQKYPEVEHKVLSPGGIEEHYKKSHSMGESSLLKIVITLFLDRNSIVHSYNNLTSEKYFKVFNLVRPKKLIFHERGNCWNFQDKKDLVQKNASLAKLIITNSHATKSLLVKRFKIEESKIEVVHNGVFTDDVALEKEVKTSSKKVVGYIGRIEAIKGIHSLIDAFSLLSESQRENLELQIWGDGEARDYLEEYSRGKGSIRFMGRSKDPFSAIRGFDLLVIPSIREPFGNVAIEGAQLKVPVVASCVDGLAEIVDEGKSGRLIPLSFPISKEVPVGKVPIPLKVINPNDLELIDPKEADPEVLKEILVDFIENSENYQQYAENLYLKAKDQFHVNTFSEKIISLYNRL